MHKKILGNDENRAARGFDKRGPLAAPGRGLPGEGKYRSPRSRTAQPLASVARACGTVSFSTDDLPEQDRVAMWREHFGRTALRVEIEPAQQGEFEASVTSRIFPGLHLLQSGLSAARLTR